MHNYMGITETFDDTSDDLDIAIVGMAGRFPGAINIEEFWQNIRDGKESVTFFSDEELKVSGIAPAELSDPQYVKARPILKDIEMFDASFFNFSAKEAELTDPQHRLFLECAYEALESAGYAYTQGYVGVYAGSSMSSYMLNHYSNPDFIALQEIASLGNDLASLATRISYKLNLKGPSINIQTYCSTSLVAVHLACQSLLNYECDMALAGGVSIQVPQKAGYHYKQDSSLSPDGHCRTFDAKAQGIVFGNGLGIVVLKRLEDALVDGDIIHAVIKGSAINNDGSFKASYTAPSVDGQADVILQAVSDAGVKPDTINYIEAHGTGTSIGDPIEIAALTQAYGTITQKKRFCAIGSVKTNIGHLDAAAGVVGLIKTTLALKHKQIPPSLHFEQPNPKIDFNNSPFYVNTALSEWKSNGTPRRAGVSAFGFGGTNAHVILEEAPPQEISGQWRPWQLLMLSAKTSSALEIATANLVEHLKQHPDLNLVDVAYTLQAGRRVFDYQRTVVCQDIEDAIVAFQDPKRVLTSMQQTTERSVAFMFTGLGTQYLNMAWELYQIEPIFKETVDHCSKLLKPLLGFDLADVLYPHQNQTNNSHQQPNPTKTISSSGLDLRRMLGRQEQPADEATQKLNQTFVTQPAIFVIEYALAQLWISWGIQPVAMIGYSIGEYVAARLAGVFSLEDALTLVVKRAQMIQALPSGAMLAVPLPEDKVRLLLNANLSLSAINGSSVCVVAGTTDAVDELASQLTEQGLACRYLQTSHAFHSHIMEVIAQSFTELVKTINLQPPKIPYVSNVTGTWITAEQTTDPNYWTQHLCQPVLFADGLNLLWKQHKPIFLEVGPGQTLSSLAMQCLESEQMADKVVLSSLRDSYNQQSDLAFLLSTLGQLWLSGAKINWLEFYAHERRQRIPLPTYPFERQRYWIDPFPNTPNVNSVQEKLEQKLDIADWFYVPSWKQTPSPISFAPEKLIVQKHCWLVFIDSCEVGSQLVERLERNKQDVIVVRIGEQFNQFSEREYTINPQNRDDYNALLKALNNFDKTPQIIAHLWNITSSQYIPSRLEYFDRVQELGFYSLLFLAQAWGEQGMNDSVQITVVSNNMQQLLDEEELYPEKATILGSCKVISQEYSNICCRSVDITLPQSGTRKWQQLIDQLLAEVATETSEQVIAYRGNHRWVQDFEALPMKALTPYTERIRQGGVYLITGGLGKLGLIVAEYLAKTVQAKLVLIGRSGLPAKDEWQQWLSSDDESNSLRTKIKKVQSLEELGAEVLVIQADVSNYEQMQAMVNQVRDHFGEIHGVIHTAGTASASFVQQKTPEIAKRIFEPKVKGTLVLDSVLKDTKLDFLVLFSSMSSITGGLGQADYCAASTFLDAFAHDSFSRHERLTVSINWDGWQENNLQDQLMSSYGPEILAEIKQFRETYAIASQEGVKALEYILSSTLPQVIVSTRNLRSVIEHEDNELSTIASFLENIEKNRIKSVHKRPLLKTVYVAPSNDIQYRIAQIYQELLGIEQVGINDSFFELGGNSLIGIQLISRLCQNFEVQLSITSLFESPSVAELALIIEESIIMELKELTEDEAHNLELVKE